MKPSVDQSAAPLLVVTFYPTITFEEVRAHFAEMGEFAERYDRVGVVVDLSNTPLFTPALGVVAAPEMRAAARKLSRCCVGVAHATASAAGRATLAAMQWLVPPPFPTLVTSSLGEATSWVRARLGRTSPFAGAAVGARGDARTVSGFARAFLSAARALGCSIEGGLGFLGGDVSELDGSVAHGTLMAIVAMLASRSGDDGVGLTVGAKFVDAATFGMVGLAARASATLGDALARVARHDRLVDENCEIGVSVDSAGARIVLRPLAPLEWPRAYAEFLSAALLELMRASSGVRFAAAAVGFAHGAPSAIANHTEYFGCEPAFGARENFMVVPAALLAQRLVHSDAVQCRYFDARLEELCRSFGEAPGPLAEVRATALSLLSQGTPTIAAIGSRLGVSRRTLQRRLNERGVTFADLLDSARREAALKAIARRDVSVEELALSSGFTDVKAFRRAFTRWTGQSPSQYRKSLG